MSHQRVNTAIIEEMKKSGKITDDEQMKKLVKGEYCVNKLNIFLILDFVNAVG